MTHHSSAGSDGLELDSSSVQAEWDAIRRDGAHQRPSDRVLSQLRQQLAELERREQSLNAQALAVDAERRHLRWERREFDELVAERERQFAGLEASTTEQLKLREQADADLAAQAALLAQERAQWDSERTSLREALRAEVLEEVRREQSTVIETPEPQPVPLVDLEQERAAALAALAEEVEQQRRSRQEALEQELAADLLKLREQADADLAAQAALLAQERAQWDSERTSLREALRAEVLEEVRREQSTVIETPEPQPVPLVDLEQERAAALAVLAEEVEQQRLGRQAALERELTAEAERLRSCADEELENVERLAARREQLTADLAGLEAQQAELTSELEQARLQHESELERRLQEVAQKQIDLEKRTRFHEVHLSQLRETLSQQREELEHREQSVQVRHVRMASAQRLQARHLAAFRERLEEREQSLLREKSLAEQARQMHDEEQQRRASEWQQERHEWQSAVEQQQSENHRQRDLLILQSRNLEGRRQRLDRLRNELETAHYETLELRVAVEQACGAPVTVVR